MGTEDFIRHTFTSRVPILAIDWDRAGVPDAFTLAFSSDKGLVIKLRVQEEATNLYIRKPEVLCHVLSINLKLLVSKVRRYTRTTAQSIDHMLPIDTNSTFDPSDLVIIQEILSMLESYRELSPRDHLDVSSNSICGSFFIIEIFSKIATINNNSDFKASMNNHFQIANEMIDVVKEENED